MTLMNMFTHIHKVTYLYATPEAEPRGILLIKTQIYKVYSIPILPKVLLTEI